MVMPYLSFKGDCEEAFKRYAEIFNGRISHLSRYEKVSEAPEMPVGEDMIGKVMHAEVLLMEAGGISGCDATWPVAAGNSVSIHADLQDAEQARKIFAALADGGVVIGPLAVNPPPDDHGISGMVRDRYGFVWIISAPADKK